ARVILQCPERLTRLLATCPGIDQFVVQGSTLPDFDVQSALLSLPRIVGTSAATIPANIPYLFADAELIERWRPKLSSVEAFKIGIAWQGNLNAPLAERRSVPLEHFAQLAELPGVCLVSLQKDPGHPAANFFPITVLDGLDQGPAAFTDTAAVMKNVDLVVTADTATAHLAGALGVPVWVALSFVP